MITEIITGLDDPGNKDRVVIGHLEYYFDNRIITFFIWTKPVFQAVVKSKNGRYKSKTGQYAGFPCPAK
jgi:hypothetical protein